MLLVLLLTACASVKGSAISPILPARPLVLTEQELEIPSDYYEALEQIVVLAAKLEEWEVWGDAIISIVGAK